MAPVEPLSDAVLDNLGRFVDSSYRLWHAHKEFGQSFPPDVFTVLSERHRLDKFLKYVAKEPKELTVGDLIEGPFLSLFRLQDEQLRKCSLYVRRCYVEYRTLLLTWADDCQKKGLKLACRLGGNPGIGKSTFLVYLLLELLKEAHRNDPAGDESKHEDSIRLREKALRLKIFLSDGSCFYVYSRRTGWLQVNNEKKWIEMHMDKMNSQDAWLLVDGYDIPETASSKTLLVSSPNIRNYARFAKNRPRADVLPTLPWNEVEEAFDKLLAVVIADPTTSKDVLEEAVVHRRFVMSRLSAGVPSEDEKVDETSEIAEFFAADAEMVFYLDKKRLAERFRIWGGVLRKLFSLTPLAGLKSLFKDEKAAKLWAQFMRGDFALFDTATEENLLVGSVLSTNVLHGIFEPGHVGYIATGEYKCITDCGKTALAEWLSLSDWKDLMATYVQERENRGPKMGYMFEVFCHRFFCCRSDDRSLYFRKLFDDEPEKDKRVFWLDLPRVTQRKLTQLSDVQAPGVKPSSLLYFKPYLLLSRA